MVGWKYDYDTNLLKKGKEEVKEQKIERGWACVKAKSSKSEQKGRSWFSQQNN